MTFSLLNLGSKDRDLGYEKDEIGKNEYGYNKKLDVNEPSWFLL